MSDVDADPRPPGPGHLPAPVGAGGVDVRWHRVEDERDPLARHVAAVLGVPGDEVRTGRLCPRCGSSAHGRPWARHPSEPRLFVSLARAGGYAVTAVSLSAPLGVDVEEVAAVARGWSDEVILAQGEQLGTVGAPPVGEEGGSPDAQGRRSLPRVRALTWAAKEATLKRTGEGLHTPMTRVRLTEVGGLHELAAPPGLVAVLAAPL